MRTALVRCPRLEAGQARFFREAEFKPRHYPLKGVLDIRTKQEHYARLEGATMQDIREFIQDLAGLVGLLLFLFAVERWLALLAAGL